MNDDISRSIQRLLTDQKRRLEVFEVDVPEGVTIASGTGIDHERKQEVRFSGDRRMLERIAEALTEHPTVWADVPEWAIDYTVDMVQA